MGRMELCRAAAKWARVQITANLALNGRPKPQATVIKEAIRQVKENRPR